VKRLSATLGTRVARRVVGLFLLCALLPVALTIGLTYGRIQGALVDERILQLGQAAESYGTTLLERLRLADQLARSLAAAPESAATSREGLAQHFRSIAIVAPGGPPRLLLGEAQPPAEVLAAASDPRVAAGEPTLRTPVATAGPRGVWLVRPIAAGEAEQGILAAELAPEFLWGTEDELPFNTDLCVLDASRAPLHCTAPLPAAALDRIRDRLAHGPSGHYAWEADSERRISSYRELFLEAKFRAASWPIVMSQPEEYALAPTRAVARLVVPVVVLGLLIAALLGLVQVRRTMDPLQRLTDATKRIAGRDFGARLETTRADEFGELARAFNSMSERLGRQFHALGALAQIDSVILSKVDIDRIVAIALGRMKEVVRADWRIVLLADPAEQGSFQVHAPDGPAEWNGSTAPLAFDEIVRLAGATRGIVLTPEAAPQWLAPLVAAGAGSVFLLPIKLDARLAGAIVLGHRGVIAPDDDERRLVQDLGDRVAVALATAARDRELHRRAHYDPLTGLPNRTFFLDELGRELDRAERQAKQLAVLFVDLDGFSEVNDSLGHSAGDELLLRAAERLRACVRKSDLVARLGGDEFTAVLPDMRESSDAATVAQHLIAALSEPYDIGHGDTFVAASVGIAMYPADGATAPELLRHADMAMYRAKERGRGSLAFFEDAMHREAQRRLALDRELRQALEHQEFVLYYQPQLDLRTNRIVGAEALIRWLHPTRGIVAPGPFISFAEETGLIEHIGAWALNAACEQFMVWKRAGVPIDHVSVNVSPRQFRRKGFADSVARAIQAAKLEPGALHLEITESVLVDENGVADATLARLIELGARLEIDDFGTGYSSLAYLQRLPVSAIKLDRTFIKGIPASDNAQAIVRAAISMVHALKKEVVAEGVETRDQLALLRAWGCDAIQGFHLSKPVPADAFSALLQSPGPARACA
jgi:diguanylate cyclase (GGDEF)-like protein